MGILVKASKIIIVICNSCILISTILLAIFLTLRVMKDVWYQYFPNPWLAIGYITCGGVIFLGSLFIFCTFCCRNKAFQIFLCIILIIAELIVFISAFFTKDYIWNVIIDGYNQSPFKKNVNLELEKRFQCCNFKSSAPSFKCIGFTPYCDGPVENSIKDFTFIIKVGLGVITGLQITILVLSSVLAFNMESSFSSKISF